MRVLLASVFLVSCATAPMPPQECPEPLRVASSTLADPRGLTPKEAAYWHLAVEWAGEAKIEAASYDACRQDGVRIRAERDAAKMEAEDRYTLGTVVLWVVAVAGAGVAATAVARLVP